MAFITLSDIIAVTHKWSRQNKKKKRKKDYLHILNKNIFSPSLISFVGSDALFNY